MAVGLLYEKTESSNLLLYLEHLIATHIDNKHRTQSNKSCWKYITAIRNVLSYQSRN